jgi:hypothetical protein
LTHPSLVRGLTSEEAEKRLKLYGKNVITPPKEEPSTKFLIVLINLRLVEVLETLCRGTRTPVVIRLNSKFHFLFSSKRSSGLDLWNRINRGGSVGSHSRLCLGKQGRRHHEEILKYASPQMHDHQGWKIDLDSRSGIGSW